MSVSVEVAKGDKWNMDGQTLTVTLNINDKVTEIKSKIQEELGMPQGKQKLQMGDVVLLNSNTAAFYNFSKDTVLTLSEKTRGGRK